VVPKAAEHQRGRHLALEVGEALHNRLTLAHVACLNAARTRSFQATGPAQRSICSHSTS
jgi:hypothetical protein